MVIACDKKLYNAINKTNIYEEAENFNMSISIFKTDAGTYKTLYVFISDDDEKELLAEIEDYEDIEKLIYEDYTEEDLKDYQYHWYDEIEIFRVSSIDENKIKDDEQFRVQQIHLIDDIIDKRIKKLIDSINT